MSWDCRVFDKLGELNEFTLIWVPGHQGVQSNNVADELAKRGTQKDSVNQLSRRCRLLCQRKKTHQGSFRPEAFYFLVGKEEKGGVIDRRAKKGSNE